jgi:cysteine-rich repeat protein
MSSTVRSCLLGVAVLLTCVVGSARAQIVDPTTHLKCYKAKDPLAIRGPGPAWLTLDAGALGEEYCRIVGGFRLVCVPSSAQVNAPLEGRMVSGAFTQLIPTPLPNEEELEQDRLCYKIRCLGHPNIDTQTAFTDQFGARTLSRYKPYLVCGPAEASLCGDGNLDFGEDCDDGNKTNGDCCNSTCRNEPVTQSCGPDTDFNECTTPYCNGLGSCDQNGLLEPTSSACTDTDGNECTVARCDGTGACDQGGFLPTSACTDNDGNGCTQARCDGAGACDQSGFLLPSATPCGDVDGNGCTQAQCDGLGTCNQSAVLLPNTTVCPDTDGNECTSARCNGSGTCNQLGFVSVNGTPCTDTDGNVCTAAQCQAGACSQSVNVAVGTTCPDSDGNGCNLPGCDETGVCAQNFFVRNCGIGETCVPATGVCQ